MGGFFRGSLSVLALVAQCGKLHSELTKRSTEFTADSATVCVGVSLAQRGSGQL